MKDVKAIWCNVMITFRSVQASLDNDSEKNIFWKNTGEPCIYL